MQIRVVRGDITRQQVEAIVTAANRGLRGGGGVDGAVHRAAGPRLLEACRQLAPCPAGSAVVTEAFDLAPVSWVIHAVGPTYSGPEDAALLASAYVSALRRADEVGARSVAFPSISTGVYGYPADEAARVSVQALRSATTAVETVLLVAFSDHAATLWEAALGEDA
jgi:O-acetyl-ADP-ribose deacetylase (regulator of RNase III)